MSYAGETALAQETVDSLAGDLRRVALVTALAMFVLLAIFLRALLAPLLLLFGSLLACAAAFGITALLVPGGDLVYYVPLVGAVMLVGLGSDYNVLIAGRIREEMRRRGVREAIAVATPAASRAITVAGITLAATFALLALVPLRPFKELALLMALGVLIDALFVRPLLIPALIALAGRATWWPSRLRAPHRNGGSTRVGRATRTHVLTLGERSPPRGGRAARHLPGAEPHQRSRADVRERRFVERVAAAPDPTDARRAAAVIERSAPRSAGRARVRRRGPARDTRGCSAASEVSPLDTSSVAYENDAGPPRRESSAMPRVHLTTASMMLMIDLRLADLDRQIAEKVEALRGPNPDEQDLHDLRMLIAERADGLDMLMTLARHR